MAKRVLDILVCVIAAPFALPLMLLCALAVRLTSPGPVLFRQVRVGKNRQTFEMLKFRTMYVNAPDLRNADGSTFNQDSDPRVTSAGRFLRKTSLDELPQLINVLRGNMSIVGPRPDLPDHLSYYRPRDFERLTVRPGLTGLPQVRGRNSLSWEQRRDLDIEYVKTWSVWMDIKIMVLTVPTVLFGRGIYVQNAQPKAESTSTGRES
ncbi:MAG TPA: sugar transferase [Candidatus Koribacter sp.]|jgi:lipopolysaccharide/colanic/teichoic acid biosynthesis glycosyltransferase